MNKLTIKQKFLVKSSLVDSINQLNKLQPAFDRLHKEVSSGFHLIYTFLSWFSFHLANRKNVSNLCVYFYVLNMFVQNMLFNSGTIIAIADTSIKNNITTAVSHVFSNCGKLSKKAHHVVNVTTTEAELFAIRSTINQSCQVSSLQILFMLPRKSLIHWHIHTSYKQSKQLSV